MVSRSAKVAPLWSIQSEAAHINSFGAFLRYLREREGLSPRDLTSTFPEYFAEHRANQFLLNPDMYRKIEKGVRSPQYEELLPLYAALLGCGCKLTLHECSIYVRLARQKIEGLQRRRPKLRPAGEWRMLEISLAQLGQHTGPEAVQVLEKRLQPRPLLAFDTSHIVGRETWLAQMLTYLAEEKKVVVVRGMMGMGKTSGLKLLLQQIQTQDLFYPIFYTFSQSLDMTSEDHLRALLATILAALGAETPETAKTIPLETQVQQVIEHIQEAAQRVVLLVDDAQVVLDEQGQLTPQWEQFQAAFLSTDHHGTIYIAAREWPLWMGRNRSFLIDGDDAALPTLDATAGIRIWHRLGFTDVPTTLLEQAARKCGWNPLMIELRAASLSRPRFAFGLGFRQQKGQVSEAKKSEHQRLIERMLDEGQVFSSADVEATKLLTQVVSRRLSQDALPLLEVLSASSLALPFPLLAEVNGEAAEYGFMELLNSSLIDQDAMNVSDRAALQPLAREAGFQQLRADRRMEEVEKLLTRLYQIWLNEGIFQSEQEQAALVSELAVLYLKQHQLLQAAELLVEFGWLALAFGHAARVARIAEGVMRAFNWRAKVEDEFGGLLLQYYLLIHFSEGDLDATGRKKAYLHLYDVMTAGKVPFHVQTFVHLTTHKLLYMVRERHYEEAWSLINELCVRYEDLQNSKPTTYAELLDRRAFVRGRWGDYQDAQAQKLDEPDLVLHLRQEAFQHRQEAVVIHQQCIDLLRQCERFASPIEKSRILFKRARLLNDLAYYERCVGLLEDARSSMEECLRLKEAGYVVPISLAVSYDDFSQLNAQLGSFRAAESYSDRALQIAQAQIAAGNTSALHEKGMFLINRGKLFLLLGQLEQARALFEEGIPLVEGTTREDKVAAAREGLRTIEVWRKENPQCSLDKRWFSTYQSLADYSDVGLLAQAGPFLEEEQREWERLWANREEETAKKRLSALINQSRKRELAACWAERRNPRGIHYPRVDLEDVRARIAGFESLSAEIRQNEPNAIVRKLYLKSIEERLNELHLICAAGEHDDERFWEYNKRLNGLPNPPEIDLALRYLADLIRKGLKRDDTKELSEQLIQQARQWSVQLMELEPAPEEQVLASSSPGKLFSPETVQRFFADVFRRYQFNWTIEWDATADHPWVNFSRRQLILPEGKKMTTAKIRQLLGHEIEMHAFRSSSGERSPLALLSTGLDGYLDVEEGLALDYTEDVANAWIGTLAISLATGAICKPFTFIDLLFFFEQVNLLKNLLGKKGGLLEDLQKDARIRAQNRCLRTWRGVSQFEVPGICSTKDTVYLRGYIAVKTALKEGTAMFEQLMVGSVALHHLDDLAELGLVRPSVTHLRLSTDPNLERYILRFAETE